MADTGKKKKKKTTVKLLDNNQDENILSPNSSAEGKGIEDYLKAAATAAANGETKKKKKKKKTIETDEVLESLKQGVGIKKDNEDLSLLANTYNIEDSPRYRKNMKENNKKVAGKGGVVNEGFLDDSLIDNQDETTPKKAKKKKKPKATDLESEYEMENLTKKGKKTKKAAKSLVAKQEVGNEVEETELKREETLEDLEQTNNEDETEEDPTVKKKGKKKKKKKDTVEGREAPVEEAAAPTKIDDGRVLAVNIHKTDRLTTDLFLAHPLVRIHIVDINTGKYVKKRTKERAVTSYYETKNEKVDFVLPIMTQPFDFKKRRSLIPAWEELIVFNEDFLYFLQQSDAFPDVVIFFELLDFVSMGTASLNNDQQDGGWHRVAWAFLKLVSSRGQKNIEKKIRLQLYHPPSGYRAKTGSLDVYQWWSHYPRQVYPSTLYVTVKGIVQPDSVDPSSRSMIPTQEEQGTITYNELKQSMELGTSKTNTYGANEKSRLPGTWTRLHGQLCHVPNKLTLSLSAGTKGCFVVKFSNDGRSLACGCSDVSGYPLLVYEIPSGRLKGQFLGHYSIIYDLCWSNDDSEILSASSDATARIWTVEKFGTTAEVVFPHPSFVYTAKYHPVSDWIIVTGSYDYMIRVWSKRSDRTSGELLQELEGHNGWVNSLCFIRDGPTCSMYSADSQGVIIVWNTSVKTKMATKGSKDEWEIKKVIKDRELEGVTINCIKVHPSNRRLLIQCKDNTLRMMDLRIFTIVQRYVGSLNFREHLRSTLSTCGTFLIAGSEDYQAYVWNTDTGDQVAVYSELKYKQPVSDVDFHPFDHMIAFCSLGENQSVLVYTYDKKVAQLDLGLREPVKVKEAEGEGEGEPGGSAVKQTKSEEIKQLYETKASLTDQLNTQESIRRDRVAKKLASVTAFAAMLRKHREAKMGSSATGPGSTLGRGTSLLAPTQTLSTWGSTFDYTPWESDLQNPSVMSPHASMGGSGMATTQQMAASVRLSSTIGKRTPAWSAPRGRSPNISMTTSGNNAVFSFNAVPSPLKDIKQRTVVAMYNYTAQRSDELTFRRGDIIKVLHQDNENWWMGELANGQQGYFPANYITSEQMGDDNLEIGDYVDGSTAAESGGNEVKGEKKKKSPRSKGAKTTVTAVVDKAGELKFISGAEDSEQESSVKREKKRTKRTTALAADLAADTAVESSAQKLKEKPRKMRQTSQTLEEAGEERVTIDRTPKTEKKGTGKRKAKSKDLTEQIF